MEDARALGLDEVVKVPVVERLQLGLGDVGAGELLVELVLDQLLDHGPLHLVFDGGALVEPLALSLLGEQLVADQVLEELPLAVERVVARAQERAGLVEPVLELRGGDDLVAHLGDDGSGLRRAALVAGDGGEGKENGCEASLHRRWSFGRACPGNQTGGRARDIRANTGREVLLPRGGRRSSFAIAPASGFRLQASGEEAALRSACRSERALSSTDVCSSKVATSSIPGVRR